ncbi:MarR family transcriptional regulator [Stenotrophomonas sp. STM01]|jgi:MarR family transcriptional repressor of emrRAB|uniref:MarR family winged helix-turn-helix transcriptional regulator n=1 Tax=unclassified Stenotrophomonas TaxID=196198 RepID=UPI00178346DF|nr:MULTISPECIES: MarR family transcriptional regulator [unclassified Stenotrophomonas]MBD9537627.1 MarR family transcriptional regulator [Stenotrophomonas sp. STM01]
MSSFDPTEIRIDATCNRWPGFPREPAVLVRLVKGIYKSVHDHANAVLRDFDLCHAEYNVLMMLYGTPDRPVSPSELAGAATEKSANITRLTDLLCRKGLLERIPHPEDRRKLDLRLTHEGVACVERMLPAMSGLLLQQVEGLNEAEQHQLEALLKKMLAGIDAI